MCKLNGGELYILRAKIVKFKVVMLFFNFLKIEKDAIRWGQNKMKKWLKKP